VVSVASQRTADEERVWQLLAGIPDPEIPVISIVDLGIVRQVLVNGGSAEVALTSTYSGCPATDVIHRLVGECLASHGLRAKIRMLLSPAWTTDWISAEGRRKLAEYGIVPPRLLGGRHADAMSINDEAVACPRCQSERTERLTEFGSTPCKSLYRCGACLEPFERFKCL
jgi:ring-1,2-phenylacetyl-CoA epoxidase subunit PaaD